MLSTKDLQSLLKDLRKFPQTMVYPDCPVTQILDNGHGGMIGDNYTTAPNKMCVHDGFTFYEGLWNRVVVWLAVRYLASKSLSYHVLVPDDFDMSISDRVKRADDANFPKPFFHSIHGNYFGIEEVCGIEVFTGPGETPSDRIATVAYQEYDKNLHWRMRPDFGDGDPDKEARFGVLVKTIMPAILSELGFYSNPEQVRAMLSMPTIGQMAMSIANIQQQVIKYKLL